MQYPEYKDSKKISAYLRYITESFEALGITWELQQLQVAYPFVDWVLYFSGMGADITVGEVIMNQSQYLTSLNSKFKLPVNEPYLNFRESVSGSKYFMPRNEKCTDVTLQAFDWGIGKYFAQKPFPPSSKSNVIEMITEIKSSFQRRINGATWMDETTRA